MKSSLYFWQKVPRKNEALFNGALVTPISSTAGWSDGSFAGSMYGVDSKRASRCVAMVTPPCRQLLAVTDRMVVRVFPATNHVSRTHTVVDLGREDNT